MSAAAFWDALVGELVSVELTNGRATGRVDEVRNGGSDVAVFLRPDREYARELRIVFSASAAKDVQFIEESHHA